MLLPLCLLLTVVPLTRECRWPSVDALFVLDGTSYVGEYNFKLQLDFISKAVNNMQVGDRESRVAVAQYTPQASYDIVLATSDSKGVLRKNLQGLEYKPCSALSPVSCRPLASLNSLASFALSSQQGNRKLVPDVVLVISTPSYPVPELGQFEVLYSPASPTHVFFLSVGTTSSINSDRIESSATTLRLTSTDFENLDELVNPLCESVNAFVKGGYHHGQISSLCTILLIMIALIFLLILTLLGIAIYRYYEENSTLKKQLAQAEKNLRSQNEYFTARLQKQMEEQIRMGEEHNKALLNHPVFVPNYWGNDPARRRRRPGSGGDRTTTDRTRDRRRNLSDSEANNLNRSTSFQLTRPKHTEDGTEDPLQTSRRPNEISPLNLPLSTDRALEHPNSVSSDSDDVSESDEGDVTKRRVARDHPARLLPPVDILFLVDNSSSIGISNFEMVKETLNKLVREIDIAPGRSRVAVVVFAQEPNVAFPFEKYYRQQSVINAINRLLYQGGPTFMAKALNFAAGVLWNEQNMTGGRHRKHKFAPTPRHDRLQVLVVVSDGYSEDNVERSTALLHEQLMVRVAAIITRNNHKEKLLPVTRYDGSIFRMEDTEGFNLWLWRQQRLWAENYERYMEREKTMPLTSRRSKKTTTRTKTEGTETTSRTQTIPPTSK